MPELPEVETVLRKVTPHIVGRTVRAAHISNPSVIAHPDPSTFLDSLIGRRFVSSSRRGKYLLFHLDSGGLLVLHLRMTGCLVATPRHHADIPHTHLVISLDDGVELRYSDCRRFGRFWLLSENESDSITGMNSLGLEPWDPGMDAMYLHDLMHTSRRSVKECLLDQHIVAGIGNIYSDEILHSSGILPFRKACSLTDDEFMTVASNIKDRLSFFLEKNDISDKDYLIGLGKDYRNTPYLKVYGKGGEPCPNGCGAVLIKTVVGQRGSVYCPRCQK